MRPTAQQQSIQSIQYGPKKAKLSRHVPYYDYLSSRGWYINNYPLQKKLENIVDAGFGHLVNVISGDFDEHLDKILKEANFPYNI